MQKPETKFRAIVQRKLDALPNSWFESVQQRAIQGTPDILGCVQGQFVALELKSADGLVSKLQELKLKRIGAAGGHAFVVYPHNLDNTMIYLDALANGQLAIEGENL